MNGRKIQGELDMRFEELDTDFIYRLGTPADADRARELVDNKQVRFRYRLANSLQAVVWDNDQPIPVTVSIDNGQLQSTCACPEGVQWCPYALSVLLAWVDNPESFLNRTALKDRLKQYSKHELIKIILDLADKVQEVREILREENLELEDILENIDHIISEAGEVSAAALPAVEEKLRHSQSMADRLAESGRLSEARAIYFYLLDNIYGVEEEKGGKVIFSPEFKRELFEEYCQFIHEDRNLDLPLVQQEVEQLESRAVAQAGQLDFTEIKKMLAQE